MNEKRIHDFAEGDKITGFFSVRKKTVRDYYKGRFVSLELGDNSGRINAVSWEPDQFALEELAEGMVVKVRGIVSDYQGKTQLTTSRMRLATDNEYTLDDLLPCSEWPVDERRARILALTEKIENSYIRQLADSFWTDEKFFDDFLKAAAGKLWHHATVGGLSEHSISMTELALRAASGYDFLNKDYLIFGGLFHDAGKINTYKLETMIDYTDEGRLVDHICIADDWICQRARKIEDFPEKLLMKLRHMILSHQGEYSTPVVPKMPEAFVLYYCDEIDSKMGAISRIRDRQNGVG